MTWPNSSFYAIYAAAFATLVACGDKSDSGDGGTPPAEVVDADGDGYDESIDCNDSSSAIFPGADELCNGLDDDCDDAVDEDPVEGDLWFQDEDGDGFGDEADAGTLFCDSPTGMVDVAGDCDDGDPAFNPDAEEDCADPTDYNCDGSVAYMDEDEDGWAACEDCNDGDPARNPDATELCNELDDDCDGTTDEDDAADAATWYADSDGDGFGDPGATTAACTQPAGYVDDNTDCDDTSAEVRPDVDELCNEIDDDCDGTTDEDDAADAPTWYLDDDGDGYGDPDLTLVQCTQPGGYLDNALDCDDSTADLSPDATEICDEIDNDCDGATDDDDSVVDLSTATTWYKDADGDGYGTSGSTWTACAAPSGYLGDNTDCDDTNAGINPAATEVCDAADTDEDCSGSADNNDAGADLTTGTTWYPDADEDGYGDMADSGSQYCDDPSTSGDAWISSATDCDDGDADIHPGATEICDAADTDEDCSGDADDADSGVDSATMSSWYLDADQDGWGSSSSGTGAACDDPSTATAWYTPDDEDCDDTDAAINPGATEICDADNTDEDCSGAADDADSGLDSATTFDWFADADQDGFGDADGTATALCDDPSTVASAYLMDVSDCDDSDAAINPAATEICDADDTDEDCSGAADDADSGTDASSMTSWSPDTDLDGYGDEDATITVACEDPSDSSTTWVDDATDCDDGNTDINPAATEVCDADDTDEDCDGLVDEDDPDADLATYYADTDADGYGDPDTTVDSCDEPSGYTDDDSDCDDSDADINPDGTERYGNGIDEDCDDEDEPSGLSCLGDSVPSTYATVADAVAAAASGSAVYVCLDAGTHTENVDCGYHACRISGHGRGRSTLKGSITGDDTVAVYHLSVTGGVATNSTSVNIYNSNIECGSASYAVETSNNTGQLLITRSDISCSGGGGIHAISKAAGSTGSSLTVTNSYIHDSNTGLYWYSAGNTSATVSAYLVGNTFDNNTTAIHWYFSPNAHYFNWRLINNLITNNTTGYKITTGGGTSKTYDLNYNNLWYGNTSDGYSKGTDYVTTDPEYDTDFVPPRPSTTGGAYGAAWSTYLDSVDFWNESRDSSGLTLGAVEP